MKYSVNLDKRIFVEFILFEWYGEPAHWKKYPNNKFNYFHYLMKTKPRVLEEAIIYIEQMGDVIWDWKDRHAQILNSLVPMADGWGKKDFILEWKKYKKKFYEGPWKPKHKFEY